MSVPWLRRRPSRLSASVTSFTPTRRPETPPPRGLPLLIARAPSPGFAIRSSTTPVARCAQESAQKRLRVKGTDPLPLGGQAVALLVEDEERMNEPASGKMRTSQERRLGTNGFLRRRLLGPPVPVSGRRSQAGARCLRAHAGLSRPAWRVGAHRKLSNA